MGLKYITQNEHPTNFAILSNVKQNDGGFTSDTPKEDPSGMQVVCVINLPPKKIGHFISDVLTLGLADENGDVILLRPTQKVPRGGKMF